MVKLASISRGAELRGYELEPMRNDIPCAGVRGVPGSECPYFRLISRREGHRYTRGYCGKGEGTFNIWWLPNKWGCSSHPLSEANRIPAEFREDIVNKLLKQVNEILAMQR